MLPDQFTKQIRCPLVLVQYLQSYKELHQVNLPRAPITRREVSGMTWVSCGSSLANTAFYLAAGAAHGFWPVFSNYSFMEEVLFFLLILPLKKAAAPAPIAKYCSVAGPILVFGNQSSLMKSSQFQQQYYKNTPLKAI